MFPGSEIFPANIDVHFDHSETRVRLALNRDDYLTSLLSESVFENSRFLPSDVYKDTDSEVSQRCARLTCTQAKLIQTWNLLAEKVPSVPLRLCVCARVRACVCVRERLWVRLWLSLSLPAYVCV